MSDLNYANDREFGDKFMDEVKAILGIYLFTTEYEKEDSEHNTDLMMLQTNSGRVGVRIRRYRFWNYNDEFTIRYAKQSRAETEFSKIMKGWGDYFFYGFANENETELIQWFLGDFKTFRKYILNQLYLKGGQFLESHAHTVHVNNDTFLSFKINEIPDFIISDSSQCKVQISRRR